jgi:hypothetical protein
MKKLLLPVLLILAFPILLRGSRSNNPGLASAQCIEMTQAGNCVEVAAKAPAKHRTGTGDTKPIPDPLQGLGVMALIFLMLMMRR